MRRKEKIERKKTEAEKEGEKEQFRFLSKRRRGEFTIRRFVFGPSKVDGERNQKEREERSW